MAQKTQLSIMGIPGRVHSFVIKLISLVSVRSFKTPGRITSFKTLGRITSFKTPGRITSFKTIGK